jgi:hypothetical protein
MQRRAFLGGACTVAVCGVLASDRGSATGSDGSLDVVVRRHESLQAADDDWAAVLAGVDLFAETWDDATPGAAEVTTETATAADFDLSTSHTATLDALEDDALGSDRTPETVTLFVVEDGSATAGAMRSYAGHDGRGDAGPGAYGYVNVELAAAFGLGLGTPTELIRNFAAHECGHAVLGWAEFPHYPADATESDPSPALRAHSCGAQDHPDATGWLVSHGITPMATGYSARESRNTPREHEFATEQGDVDASADPIDESWSYLNVDYVAEFSETSRRAMARHYRQFLA